MLTALYFCLALQVMNLSASTGSLVAITVERYRAICLPFTPPLSKFQAKLTIAIVSMTSFLVALPEVGGLRARSTVWLRGKLPNANATKGIFASPLPGLLPVTVVVYCPSLYKDDL